jgi:hypothetical protein
VEKLRRTFEGAHEEAAADSAKRCGHLLGLDLDSEYGGLGALYDALRKALGGARP